MDHSTPLSYGVLLYPGFEILDVAGPLEALNCLARNKDTRMTLSVIAKSTQPVNPGPVLPDTTSHSFAGRQLYLPTHTLADVPPLDILIVPGGLGAFSDSLADEIEFIRERYPSLKYLITVCTGALLAAKAGVLDSHCATSNKNGWDEITKWGKRTYWVGHARWVVSGNIWTTSGVSAGTDGALAWIESAFKHGKELVEDICNQMEYTRVQDSWDDPFAQVHGAKDVPPVQWCSHDE